VRERGEVRILLVEDDDGIALPLVKGLEREGYDVDRVANGAGALAHEGADLVLLDLRLPDLDGFEVCRRLRSASTVPIIVVSARGEEADRVIGLELGADDYLAKPFDPRELLARLRSVLRRMQASAPARSEAGEARGARIPFGHCQLDLGSHQLFDRDGAEIPITTMEFELLKVFAEHPGKALSRDRILTLTKNREWDPYDRSIDIRVARLRRKVEIDPDNPQLIRTVRGVGYMFVSAV
jgi:two-component system phosphate regulon response regulator OmpR